jgi:pimeloyl-ACP methyl ester carboxylesterase
MYVSLVGDVVGYTAPGDPTYDAIQTRITQGLEHMFRGLIGERDPDVTVIGHSLGAVILLDHIWKHTLLTPMFKVSNVVTLGSPYALYTQNRRLSEIWYDRWINIFSKHDPFAIKMSPLPGYEHVRDVHLPVGPIPWRWTPLCHEHYWTSKEVAKRIVRECHWTPFEEMI